MKIFICLLALYVNLFSAWIMFSDGDDTYIYNNVSGDVYIRYKNGGKNYEDNFIKMPSGIIPPEGSSKSNKKDYNLESELLDSQRKILDNALQ